MSEDNNVGEGIIQRFREIEESLDEHAMGLINIKSEMESLSSSVIRENQNRDYTAQNPKRSLERVILRIIRVLDGFDQTVESNPQLLKSQLNEILNREGISCFYPAVGGIFDPSKHEPIGKVLNNEIEEGTIIKVLKCGYNKDSEIIRRAEVDISVKS